MGKGTFLNGGLYRNTCQRLNIFVRNVVKNFMDGSARIGNFARTHAGSKFYLGKIQKKGRQVKCLIANFVKKSFMFQGGEQRQIGGNIVQENVIGKTNQKNIQARGIRNMSMEELKNIMIFILPSNGEGYGKKYMRGIIGLVKFAENTVGNYMPIISFQLENVRTHSENQILSPCAESVTCNSIVSNNRTGGENEFYT